MTISELVHEAAGGLVWVFGIAGAISLVIWVVMIARKIVHYVTHDPEQATAPIEREATTGKIHRPAQSTLWNETANTRTAVEDIRDMLNTLIIEERANRVQHEAGDQK